MKHINSPKNLSTAFTICAGFFQNAPDAFCLLQMPNEFILQIHFAKNSSLKNHRPTESYPPVYHHRPSKQLDVDAVEEEPPSAEVVNMNNASASRTLHTTLIVTALLLVMHWPVWIF